MILTLTNDKNWDIVVVGTGPVGMAVALEFDRLGKDVLLLESGSKEPSDHLKEASRAKIVNADRHAEMNVAVCRALGGTSWIWGGRCVAYDDIDFADRPHVANSCWPIDHSDIKPFYGLASNYLLCGNDKFEIPYSQQLNNGLTLDFVERWSRESRIILEHRDRIVNSNHVMLVLNSTVIRLLANSAEDSIKGLIVSDGQKESTIFARTIILALGGVETTRLLLNTQKHCPTLFGGINGALGRYYMGHISGKVSTIVLDNKSLFTDLDFKLDESGAYHRRRFMLTSKTQVDKRLLNTSFWPDNPPFYDPDHRSGVLSSVFLALVFPPIGRKLLPEAIRLAHTGPKPYKIREHILNAVVGAPRSAGDIFKILRDRFVTKPKKPGFLVQNQGDRYALHYHAEQAPNSDSRITLSDERDQFGMARATIDLRFSDQDVDSVIDSHDNLDKALRSNNLGKLEYWYSPSEMRQKIYAQATDGFHQIGSTRMGTDPKSSVVDGNLKVHGLDNLYVASSSVFVSGGQANSTLLAVALGLRLVNRLFTNESNSDLHRKGILSRTAKL